MTLLTLKAAGKRLGVSPTTVRVWIDRGTLPAHEVAPNRYRVPSEAIDRILGRAEDRTPLRVESLTVRDARP